MGRYESFTRKTKETDINIKVNLDSKADISIDTSVPFLDHMLNAMSFHGEFGIEVKAKGDTEVDPHHLVEDTGLVFGEVLKLLSEKGKIKRYGHSVIPMDEALSEVTIDVCGRPVLVYNTVGFPQERAGNFDISLIKEFMAALVQRAKVSLHINMRYGENSHHMVEACFKALGKTIMQAYTLDKEVMSTKGTIE